MTYIRGEDLPLMPPYGSVDFSTCETHVNFLYSKTDETDEYLNYFIGGKRDVFDIGCDEDGILINEGTHEACIITEWDTLHFSNTNNVQFSFKCDSDFYPHPPTSSDFIVSTRKTRKPLTYVVRFSVGDVLRDLDVSKIISQWRATK